jgi:hypothetical protein
VVTDLPIVTYPLVYTYPAPGWAIASCVPTYSYPVVVPDVTAEDDQDDQPVTIAPPTPPTPSATLTGVTVTANPLSPQPVNTPITLQATANGGTQVQYQFWLSNPAAHTWTQLQAASAAATCLWTPTAAGNYIISVTAQDTATGAQVNVLSWYTIQ